MGAIVRRLRAGAVGLRHRRRKQAALRAKGAVGDILSRYIDAEGNIVDAGLDARTIGLDLRYCAERDFSIGVAAGAPSDPSRSPASGRAISTCSSPTSRPHASSSTRSIMDKTDKPAAADAKTKAKAGASVLSVVPKGSSLAVIEAGASSAQQGHAAPTPTGSTAIEVNLTAVRAPRRDAADAPHGQEGVAGGLAGQGRALHRPDDARRRRHAGPRAPALRQGAPPAARRYRRGARPRRRAADGRRGLRLSDAWSRRR